MTIKYLIFDLDGTLTDTLEDLYLSTNHALRSCQMPERTMEEVRSFVGNGVHRLIERAVPERTKQEEVEQCFTAFRAHYVLHCQDHSGPYPGILEMLSQLKAKGYHMAIVSNKLQAGVDELHETFFRDTIDIAIGERPGVNRKPAPDMLLLALQHWGARPEECLYIGDSEVDVATARASQLPCLSVLWGFRTRAELLECRATHFVEKPAEIFDFLTE